MVLFSFWLLWPTRTPQAGNAAGEGAGGDYAQRAAAVFELEPKMAGSALAPLLSCLLACLLCLASQSAPEQIHIFVKLQQSLTTSRLNGLC